jgi:hypothetical protein
MAVWHFFFGGGGPPSSPLEVVVAGAAFAVLAAIAAYLRVENIWMRPETLPLLLPLATEKIKGIGGEDATHFLVSSFFCAFDSLWMRSSIDQESESEKGEREMEEVREDGISTICSGAILP